MSRTDIVRHVLDLPAPREDTHSETSKADRTLFITVDVLVAIGILMAILSITMLVLVFFVF